MIWALAGGAGPSDDFLLGCCGVVFILPTLVILTLIGWVADAPWAIWIALAVAGLTVVMGEIMVANHQPTEDWEVADEQAMGRMLAIRYRWVMLAAVGSVGAFWVRRAVRRYRPAKSPPRLTTEERLTVVAQMESRGLATADEAERYRQRLAEPKAHGDIQSGELPPS